MTHILRARAARTFMQLKDESGQALVLALVVTGALMISTTGIIQYTTSNETAFSRDIQAQRALQISEAGLNNGMSTAINSDPTNGVAIGTVLGPNYYAVDGAQTSGSARPYWTATKTADKTWVITATGFSPSGTVSRQLQTTVYDNVTQTVTAAQTPAYTYGLYVASNSGCTTLSGGSNITSPVYVNNDLCTAGGAGIAEPGVGNTLDIYVGGQYRNGGGSMIGNPLIKVKSATIVGGCGSAICSNSVASGVYANSYSSTPQSVPKPTPVAGSIYSSGMWNAPVCTTGSFTFDNDTSRNLSLGTINNLFGSSFDCKVYDQTGTTLIGRLAFSTATKTLTISGTIFIDGSISLSSATANNVSYTGSGTIYLDGTFSSSGNELCGPPAAPGNGNCTGNLSSWDATQGELMIAALNANNATTGFSISGGGELDILAFTNGKYSATGGSMVTSEVIADTVTMSGSAKVKVPPAPPPGAPGTVTTQGSNTWKVVTGGWRQLK
jgi:hypothetical protein